MLFFLEKSTRLIKVFLPSITTRMTLSARNIKHNALVLNELNSLLTKNSRNLCSTLATSSANLELCPGIQDDICHTNTLPVFVNNHTISSSSSENNSTNQTIATTMLKRHQASSSLATSSIETVKQCQANDKRASLSSYLIEEQDCSACQYINSGSSALTSLKPAMTNSTAVNSTDVESMVEGEFLSSTKLSHRQENRRVVPSFFHSTLRTEENSETACVKKTVSSFGIFKSCSWKRTSKVSKKKASAEKAYRFKLVQGKLSNNSRPVKRRFPRTSSFNSNEDERDCDLNDFDIVEEELKSQSKRQCQIATVNESFRADQNGFTNIGDFFVWYV